MTSVATEQKSGRLPGWASTLVLFVVAGYLAVYLGGIAIIYFTKQITERSLDAKEIAKVAQHIAKFPEPLPSGFSYAFGLTVGPVSIAKIEHLPEKQELTIVAEKRTELPDASILLKQAYDMGVNLPTGTWPSNAHFNVPKIRGQAEIAGEKMLYMIGDIEEAGLPNQEGFVGCMAVKPAQKSIMVFGVGPSNVSFDIQQALGLFKSVRGF